MIERHWSALARAERADEYIQHLRHETFPMLEKIAGFVRATILHRDVYAASAKAVEFLIVTVWQNEAAIEAFSGHDTEQAVVPEKVAQMMTRFDQRARHYKVAHLSRGAD